MPAVDQAPPPEALTTEQHSIIFDAIRATVADLAQRPELQSVAPDTFLIACLSTVTSLIQTSGYDAPRAMISVMAAMQSPRSLEAMGRAVTARVRP